MKKSITHMKTLLLITMMGMLMSSCITIVDQGPRGENGKVYFGIDYDHTPPYSYWDNNDNVPLNPYFGEFYRTEAGTYDFEYFINPYEYWYGTYTLYMNYGEDGGDYGSPGRDGDDTYMLLICNPEGFYYDSWEECTCHRSVETDGSITITGENTQGKFKVNMKKVTVSERAPIGTPKYKQLD